MRRFLRVVLLLVILAGTSSANEYIWREGEAATGTTFNHHSWYENDASVDKDLMSPGVPGGAAGNWYANYITGTDDPRYIEWDDIDVSEGGTYTWWVRLAPVNTSYTYQIDGGSEVTIDLAQQHEVLNVVRPAINDVHYLGWVKVGNIDLSVGTHTLRINAVYSVSHDSTIGGVDCMCLVNFPWTPTGALQPPGSSTNPDPTPGPGVWFPLHVADDAFSPDSIIDMQSVLAATTGIPAGSKGYVTRVDDHFELSDEPGVPVKFWGLTATHPANMSTFDQQARFYAKNGINVIRRHPMISEVGESQTNWAAYDRWFKALKDNGIYSDWSVFYPSNVGVTHSFLPGTVSPEFQALLTGAGVTTDQLWNELPAAGAGKGLGGFDNFVEWYQRGEWNWESNLLQHVNPYTGIAYVDDPALAIVEVQNEDNVFWHSPLSDGFCHGSDYPAHHKLLVYMWFKWLQTQYADDAALGSAWGAGLRAGDSVVTFNPNMKIYAAWEMYAPGPFLAASEKARCGDWIRFLAETQRAHYEWRFDNVRALGFQGVQVSTGWQAGGPATAAANNWTDDAGDAIDHHVYMGGGAGGYYVGTGSVSNQSQISDPGNYILAVTRTGTASDGSGPYESVYQSEDKPAIMTEWDNSMPNQWRAEASPIFAFYGMGLQGWDGSFNFAGSYPWMETGWPGQGRGPGTWVAETPVYLAQFPAVSRSIYEGHIQQGDLVAARRMSLDDLFRGIDPLSQDLPGGGYSGSSNMYTPCEVNAIGRVTMKADASLSSSDSSKIDWSPYWDQTNKIITSSAAGGTVHQLEWDYNNNVIQVKTAETQGIIGWAGGKGAYDLGDVQINVDANTAFCSLLLTPLDGEALADSAHILVTALAQDREMGAVYGAGGNSLTAIGGPPLLLQPVQATITLGGSTIQTVKVVDIYGVPTSTEVPVASNSFTINGDYTTVYYEINRAGTPRPTITLSDTSLSPTCELGSDPADDSFQVWNTGTAPLNYTVSDDVAWLSVTPTSGSSADDTDKQTHTVQYDTSGLAAGPYTGHITVSDSTASNDPQTITVNLTVQAPPEIALDPTVLNPTVTVGANAADDTFQVWDSGDVALDYTVSDDSAWMDVSPGGGTSTGAGDKQTHTVSYSTDALAIGTYDGEITVTDTDAINSPQTIPVHLTVLPPPPVISLSTASLSPYCTRGLDAPDDTFQVWNTGDRTLDYTISDNAGWLSVSPASGSSDDAGDKVTHTVSYSTSSLPQGVYNATITITDPEATNSPQTIAVELTVDPAPPAIELSTTSLTPSCQRTLDAADQTFQVWDTGDSALNYTISDNAGWLSVSPASGFSSGPADKKLHTVSYSTSGLAEGTYDAVITVSDPSASNSPRTIDVHLTVLPAPPTIDFSPGSLSPSCLTGEDASSDSIDIWNSGESTLDYTVYGAVPDDGDSWLAVSAGTGSSADPAHKVTHTVAYSTAGLSAGTYDASIVISCPEATTPLETIPVSLTVSGPASIGVDKTSLSPSCMVGEDPAADQLQVWSASAGTIDYSISDDADWLSVSPADGISTGAGDVQSHTVTYSASSLSPGTYNATITIAAVGADNTPLDIPVQLLVKEDVGPAIQITWPTEADSPLSDSLITVTGTASDDSGVAAIWINGVLARNTGAGFSTWEATIPLNQGFDAGDANCTNLITASGVDILGNYSADADSVTVDDMGDDGLVQRVGLSFQAQGAAVPGDVDTYQFEAAAGTGLSLGLKGSGKPAPNLKLELYGVDGLKMLTQTGEKIGIKQDVPESGLYTARVFLASGGGGQYALKLSGKAPKAKVKVNGNLATAASVNDYYITMPRGSLLAASVSSKDFDPLLTVMDPIGSTIPMDGFLSVSGGKAQVKNMPLPNGPQPYLTGDYAVCVSSGNGGDGAFKLTVGAKTPKAAKERMTYPVLLGISASKGVARGGKVQLKVAGASGVPADNVFYMAGLPVVPDSMSLKGGKGSVEMTVPADMIVGSVEVCFMRSDGQVDEKSNSLDFTVALP